MEENKNQKWMTAIGMGLIFFTLLIWMNLFAPKKPIDAAQNGVDTTQTTAQTVQNQPVTQQNGAATMLPDSFQNKTAVAKFGAFAAASQGSETTETLENDLVKITFSSKGGQIKSVLMKKFEKVADDGKGNEVKSPLFLMDDAKNRFDLMLPLAGTSSGLVRSSELFFVPTKTGNTLTFRADAGNGRSLEQTYILANDNYTVDYTVNFNQLQNGVLNSGTSAVRLDWSNYLGKLEKNAEYEAQYSSSYFKINDKDPDYCDCRKDDTQDFGAEKPLKWVSNSNQFFNTTIVAPEGQSFKNAHLETRVLDKKADDLKLLNTQFDLPTPNGGNDKLAMKMYIGPNEYDRLRAFDNKMEDIIPFGASIFGTINRWLIHPLFTFLMKIIGSAGLSILALTLLVKLAVYPLTYKMVHSQAKQTALKPELDKLKAKFGDDQQRMSMESMKMYQEYGVNPVGGCMPMVLQMPIWFALYRFFPASIEFRQQSFLWAPDLSSYDAPIHLPFDMPFLGNHISLFTLIWTITTLWYTWYSMKQMQNTMAQNPQMEMMKYMQYFMPIMMFFFFNKFASGLSAYLSFSNLLNIGQTLVTKNFLIDHDKIKRDLDATKAKPKVVTGFRAKLQNAMAEQQKVQEAAKKKK
jgi:YidC/Oxa1 family membrane protein insertase